MAMETVTRIMEAPICPARSGPVNANQTPVTASYVQKQTAAHCAKSPNIPTILPPNMDAPQDDGFEAHHIRERGPFLRNLSNVLMGARTGFACGAQQSKNLYYAQNPSMSDMALVNNGHQLALRIPTHRCGWARTIQEVGSSARLDLFSSLFVKES